jgi:snapalysin
MRNPMRHPRTLLSASLGLGLGLAAALGAGPATAATTTHSAHSPAANSPAAAAPSSYAAYEGSSEDARATKAFFDAVVKSVADKRAANPGAKAVTVVYSTANAPSFRSQISQSTQIWNSSVSNVKLQEGSGADFSYREGNDPRGSYASTDGHGRGYIFLDYQQNQQYNSTRVTAHETGHVLGLPDHYSGPCSELMSGGGPGTSCQNAYPDAQERARVNTLWAGGLAAAIARVS